jgi:hypothetical protein
VIRNLAVSEAVSGRFAVYGMRFSLIIIAALALFAGGAATGASEGVSFDVSASSTNLSLTDTLEIEVVVTIVGDEGNFLISELPTPVLDDFALLSTGSSSMRSISDVVPTTSRTTVYCYRPLTAGAFAVPSLTLEYFDSEAGVQKSLESAEINLLVTPDQTGPGELPGIITLGAVVLLVIAGSAIVYWRVQKRRRLPEETTDSNGAESELGIQLRQAEVMTAHGRLADAQRLVHDSLKEYMRDRYGLPESSAEGNTAGEAQTETDAPEQLRDLFMRLSEWDGELKYGGLPRGEEEIVSAVRDLRRFLEQSSIS